MKALTFDSRTRGFAGELGNITYWGGRKEGLRVTFGAVAGWEKRGFNQGLTCSLCGISLRGEGTEVKAG